MPIIQSARLEDYSPELWALTGSKGASVMSMLRYVIGDDNFFKVLKAYAQQYAWKSVNTDDFRKVVETVSGPGSAATSSSSGSNPAGAPEFKLEYTIFRTQKGFRVMGKISQDLDTFRMPVDLKIETEGNPEEKRVEVVGTSSEFSVDTFGKPKSVIIDPEQPRAAVQRAGARGGRDPPRRAVCGAERIRRSLRNIRRRWRPTATARWRTIGSPKCTSCRTIISRRPTSSAKSLAGDLDPKWTEVWSHINLGKIFDITGQRERAVNEYNLAIRTKDDTQGAQEEAGKYLKTPYERTKRIDQ